MDGAKTPPLTALIGAGTPKKAGSKAEEKPASILLKVELRKVGETRDAEGPENVVVDFLKEAESKYGFHALHPEAKTALDLLNDADDVDMDDDNDDDIDLEKEDNEDGESGGGRQDGTGEGQDGQGDGQGDGQADGQGEGQDGQDGQDGDGTPAPSSNDAKGGEPKKRRQRAEARYDLNDPFIDDSELQWEEQAASTKDGFFVYSGPLVQQGEQLVIEKADGSLKRTKAFNEESGNTKKKGAPKKKAAPKDGASGPPAKRQKTAEKKEKEKPKETKTKEQKAAEKAAEKEQKAAEKAAEKEQKAAEKAAEKEKKAAEKEAEKAEKKAAAERARAEKAAERAAAKKTGAKTAGTASASPAPSARSPAGLANIAPKIEPGTSSSQPVHPMRPLNQPQTLPPLQPMQIHSPSVQAASPHMTIGSPSPAPPQTQQSPGQNQNQNQNQRQKQAAPLSMILDM